MRLEPSPHVTHCLHWCLQPECAACSGRRPPPRVPPLSHRARPCCVSPLQSPRRQMHFDRRRSSPINAHALAGQSIDHATRALLPRGLPREAQTRLGKQGQAGKLEEKGKVQSADRQSCLLMHLAIAALAGAVCVPARARVMCMNAATGRDVGRRAGGSSDRKHLAGTILLCRARTSTHTHTHTHTHKHTHFQSLQRQKKVWWHCQASKGLLARALSLSLCVCMCLWRACVYEESCARARTHARACVHVCACVCV